VRTGTVRKRLRPGDLAPITGIYLVNHGVRHRDRHEVVIIRGEQLPTCRTCKLNVSFEIVRPVSHLTHDWDFSGPYNLVVVKPKPEEHEDFRMFRRVHIELPITLLLSTGQLIHGFSSDLSAGGVGAVIRGEIPAVDKAEPAKITLESGRGAVSLMARFCYQSGLRHGFEFLNVSAAEREAIRRIIIRRGTRAVALTS
jgi:hypothetical protein